MLKVETLLRLVSSFVNYAFIYSKIDIISASRRLLWCFFLSIYKFYLEFERHAENIVYYSFARSLPTIEHRDIYCELVKV